MSESIFVRCNNLRSVENCDDVVVVDANFMDPLSSHCIDGLLFDRCDESGVVFGTEASVNVN